MKSKNLFLLSLLFIFLLNITFAQNIKKELVPITFEHLRINVADKVATAKWYVNNVGLEIIASDNSEVIYVADKDHNFMLELSSDKSLRINYDDINLNAFHLAFEGHSSINEISTKMLSNGAKQEEDLYTNKIGDYVLNLRDPNGFPLQLIHRVNPFFAQPVKSNIRFEHFAFNVADQKIASLWYVEFMDLKIPWSKDIVKEKNNLRTYRVPYIGDKNMNMTFELFGKDVVKSLAKQSHNIIHIAFNSENPEELAKRMVYGGAVKVGETRFNKNGAIIIDLYDPQGTPIRLIKRKKELLKN
ncbi:VOC family protein [Lutibacter citreus]|uniref:VOC family protein n=1 Tax=Lutibacter citreus TaxID=2138210 RepID=UPI000DBE9C93|nr:VOC family protein [Lutibacter citreus]